MPITQSCEQQGQNDKQNPRPSIAQWWARPRQSPFTFGPFGAFGFHIELDGAGSNRLTKVAMPAVYSNYQRRALQKPMQSNSNLLDCRRVKLGGAYLGSDESEEGGGLPGLRFTRVRLVDADKK